jgi:hypothetical protein
MSCDGSSMAAEHIPPGRHRWHTAFPFGRSAVGRAHGPIRAIVRDRGAPVCRILMVARLYAYKASRET